MCVYCLTMGGTMSVYGLTMGGTTVSTISVYNLTMVGTKGGTMSVYLLTMGVCLSVRAAGCDGRHTCTEGLASVHLVSLLHE